MKNALGLFSQKCDNKFGIYQALVKNSSINMLGYNVLIVPAETGVSQEDTIKITKPVLGNYLPAYGLCDSI